MSGPDLTGYHLLPLPPLSKAQRAIMVKGRRIPNAAYLRWREGVQLWLKSLRLPVLACPVVLDAWYIRPDRRRADAENAVSGFCDAANGILFRDDSDIHDLRVRKHLDRSFSEPRLYFRIAAIAAGETK